MRKPLIIIRIEFLSRALSAFWKRSPSLPVLLMEMAPEPLVANAWAGTITASLRSNPSFNRATREGQRVEAIAGFSRGSGRS